MQGNTGVSDGSSLHFPLSSPIRELITTALRASPNEKGVVYERVILHECDSVISPGTDRCIKVSFSSQKPGTEVVSPLSPPPDRSIEVIDMDPGASVYIDVPDRGRLVLLQSPVVWSQTTNDDNKSFAIALPSDELPPPLSFFVLSNPTVLVWFPCSIERGSIPAPAGDAQGPIRVPRAMSLSTKAARLLLRSLRVEDRPLLANESARALAGIAGSGDRLTWHSNLRLTEPAVMSVTVPGSRACYGCMAMPEPVDVMRFQARKIRFPAPPRSVKPLKKIQSQPPKSPIGGGDDDDDDNNNSNSGFVVGKNIAPDDPGSKKIPKQASRTTKVKKTTRNSHHHHQHQQDASRIRAKNKSGPTGHKSSSFTLSRTTGVWGSGGWRSK